MIRLFLGLALTAAIGWGSVWLQGRALTRARADLAAARQEVAGYAEWARVQQREIVAARAAAALDTELQMGDGADAPLSDYALRGAGRVWGRR